VRSRGSDCDIPVVFSLILLCFGIRGVWMHPRFVLYSMDYDIMIFGYLVTDDWVQSTSFTTDFGAHDSMIPLFIALYSENHNQDGRVNALYSTPSIYTDAKLASNVSWPLKIVDYFPYANGGYSYWTGYFTSRPALKGYICSLSGYYLESGMALITAEDLDDAAEKAIKALKST
ncbi:putative alpha-mannosidase, partial [Tanacetum coccineum]